MRSMTLALLDRKIGSAPCPPHELADRIVRHEAGPCGRCHEGHAILSTQHESALVCDFCGSLWHRSVRYIRRRNIGGKRGRNSGIVKTSKR